MFTSPRYLTSGVATDLSSDLQMILWELLDVKRRQGVELDYLQVFELSIECALGEVFQKIVHSQEVPAFSEIQYHRSISKPINRKVWIIDSDEYVTMLFPTEY